MELMSATAIQDKSFQGYLEAMLLYGAKLGPLQIASKKNWTDVIRDCFEQPQELAGKNMSPIQGFNWDCQKSPMGF